MLNAQQQRKQQNQPKLSPSQITDLLTGLATVRQATVVASTFQTYSNALEGFRADDLTTAITELCSKEAPQGRPSFPTLPTLIEETQKAARARFQREDEHSRQSYVSYAKENPEKFVSWAEIMSEYRAIEKRRASGEDIPVGLGFSDSSHAKDAHWDVLKCSSCEVAQCGRSGTRGLKCCNCGSPYLVAA